jgi:hypothetical protein
MKVTIWPMLRNGIVKFFSDMKFFFTGDFIKQNYYKHFLYSLILAIPIVWFAFEYMELKDTGIGFTIFLGGFITRTINWLREWYYGSFHEAPWSNEDINFGTYGGIIGTIITILIF